MPSCSCRPPCPTIFPAFLGKGVPDEIETDQSNCNTVVLNVSTLRSRISGGPLAELSGGSE